MNVGQLRALLLQLDGTELPDDAPVLIVSRYNLHKAEPEVMPVHKLNQYGQTSMDWSRCDGITALIFMDASTG